MYPAMCRDGLKEFLLKTQLVTKIIATFVLLSTMGLLLQLDGDNIALIAIFSGIAGSAATFLFTPMLEKR